MGTKTISQPNENSTVTAAAEQPLTVGNNALADPALVEAPRESEPTPPNRDRNVDRMGTESIPRLITEFAIPSVVGMLVNASYGIIDSIFLGQAVGEIGLSTITVANPIMIVFMAIAMLIGNGGNALAALRLGEGKRIDAEICLGNVITLSFIICGLVAIVASIPQFLDALLTASSATDEVRPYAKLFIQILCYGFILQQIGLGVNNFIRTAGAPNRALGTMVIGLVVSVISNYLFVMVFGWGIAGSAAATLVGQGASCIAVMWYFIFTKNVPLKFHVRFMRPHAKIILTIFAFGFPSFAVQAGMAAINFVLNFQLVTYGALSPIGTIDALASIGIVNRIGGFVVMPLVGTAVAIQPLLGYNYGSKRIARVRRIWFLGVIGATIIAFTEWIILSLFASEINTLFGISHEALLEFTNFALRVQFLMLPLVGYQIVSSNYFQATGQPAKSIFLTLTRQILFLVPLILWLPSVLPSIAPTLTGLDALYVATPVADAFSILVTTGFVLWEVRRLKRLEEGQLKERMP